MKTRRALVCAPRMPEFDREGGSRRVFHLIEFFRRAGWAVSFMAQNAIDGDRYAQTLQQMGVATYASDNPWSVGRECLIDPEELVASGGFDIALIAFWDQAERLLPTIRLLSPETRVVVDSIDLHFLRQSRRMFCAPPDNGSSGALDTRYANEMMRELNIYAASDAVLTVSQKEADLVNDFTGDPRLAYPIPDTEDLELSPVPLADRRGMLFIGNYHHPPNVQAVEYLCQEVLPRVRPDLLARHPVYIVGNGLNETIVEYGQNLDHVLMVGWVPSILPYLQSARVSLIPLVYGAGTKRKLIQSIMVGTPGVSTSIGVEGLNLEDGQHVLVANDPTGFADCITQLLEVDDLWQKLAVQGREQIMAAHGREAVGARFNSVISEIMKQPVKLMNTIR